MVSESDERARPEKFDPNVQDSYADGVSRRRLLRSSAAVGTVGAATGCLSDPSSGESETPGSETPSTDTTRSEITTRRTTNGETINGSADGETATDEPMDGRPTVYVFNTGERTMSVIDSTTDERLATTMIGTTASFPSNQYTPTLVSAPGDTLWLNVAGGVRAIDATSLETVAYVETGSDANWLERTPSGERLIVSAREPAHTQFRIVADSETEAFGEVTGRIDRTENYAGARGGPGPCDVTIGPEGAYAFVPDLYGSTLTVLDVEAFEVVARREVDPVLDGAASANPYMGTVSWNGEYLVVENDEGAYGTESIWDVSDPTRPEERVRLTETDGLGRSPLTNEIGPGSRFSYVFTPGTEDLTVLDLDAGEVTTRIDLSGQAFTGTWNRSRRKLYVPVQTANVVRVIDHESRTVTGTISVGSKPYGATAGAVRPAPTRTRNAMAALASVGLSGGGEPTYCIGNCHCGTHDRSP